MTSATFKFSPTILARLGEELNQSADQSILELIKNSYDANASACKVELISALSAGGCIKISDNGDGMDADEIANGWLVLGKSSKNSIVETRLGRRPAGSKGLGRLAALRLGHEVELVAVQRGFARRRHSIEIDWSDFEGASVVEDVPLQIVTSKNFRPSSGVQIKLSNLRKGIRGDEVKRLARSILLLTDPFATKKSGFAVSLVAPEFEEATGLLDKKYFSEADYHLVARIDENGQAVAKILDWSGAVLATAEHADLRKGSTDRYQLETVQFDFWVFILDASSFSSRNVTKGEVTQWLKTFGGVHVYQDEIRVAPYGNPGDDWLGINLARARDPQERPSTNTSLGRISIMSSAEYPLNQKTDRTGFIENDTFVELRDFATDAMNWLARWRLDRAEERRDKEKREAVTQVGTGRENVEKVIAETRGADKARLEVAFKRYEKAREKEAQALRKEIQLYRTLSTAGINAATFSHESQGNPIKVIELSANSLENRVKKSPLKITEQAKLESPIKKIKEACKTLATLGTATLSLIQASKRRVGRVDVYPVIQDTVNLMDRFVVGRDAVLELELSADAPYLRSSRAAIESIITNLINNSLRAFERAGSDERKISIHCSCTSQEVIVSVADSGPGITEVSLRDIWLPGVTTNPDGTGLGLTIVRDTLRDIGGKADVLGSGRLGGAELIIKMPILGR